MAVRKKSLSYYILLALEKAVDGYVRLEDFMYKPGYYAYGSGWEYPLDKSDLAQAFKRLRERGLIKEDKVDAGKVIFKLTGLGQDALGTKVDEKWDGKWRIVIFDIPEQKRNIRRILRDRLKMWEFVQWQKSVWATKRNVTEKLKKLIKELGVDDWIAVLESDNVFIHHSSVSDRT